MPVLILAPPGEIAVAHALAQRLLEGGGEVRCYLEEDDHELRNLGCHLAVGPLDDEMNLEGALFNCHTFMPLLPDPFTVNEAQTEYLPQLGARMANAAAASNIEQTILALPVIARSEGPVGNAYRAVRESFEKKLNPLCLIEIGFLWGDDRPMHQALTQQAVARVPIQRRVSTLKVEDLVRGLVAADDRENLHGSWEMGGSTVTVGSLAGRSKDEGPSPVPLVVEELGPADLVVSNSAANQWDLQGVEPL